MRHALGFFGLIGAAVLLGVSAAMNWQFGFGLGRTEFDSQIYGLASAAADVLKALIPFFIYAAIRNRAWSQAVAAVVVGAVCLTYSLTSSLGFSALNRADTIGQRTATATAYQDLRADLDRTKQRLGWLPEHRPVQEVKVDLQALLTKPVRKWSNGRRQTVGDVAGDCTVSTRWTRRYCPRILDLKKELAVSTQGEKLETRVAELSTRLQGMQATATVVTKADPQAAVLSDMSGLSQEQVQLALIILVALLVEVGSALGFFVVFSQWRIYDAANPLVAIKPNDTANDNAVTRSDTAALAGSTQRQLVAPESDVERFQKERIIAAEGNSLTATELYEEYVAWCEENKKEAMALPTFGKQFGELGVQKAKIAGRIRYIGVKVNVGATNDASDGERAAA